MSAPSSPHPASRMGIVFRKEFREIFRDKRTIYAVVISPLLLTPAMLGLMGSVISRQVKQERVETYTVGLVGAERAPSLLKALRGARSLRVEAVTAAEAQRQVKDRRLRAAMILPDDAEVRFEAQRVVPVKLLFDAGSDASRNASQRLQAWLRERGARLVAERLRERGLAPEMATPFQVREQPVEGGGSAGTFMLAMFLPYVLAISAIVGGVYAANDQVAGEKERGTLETLLVAPASRRDLVMGKFLAVAGVSLVSSFLSVVGIMLPFYIPLKAFEWLARGGLTLTPAAVFVMLIVQLPLAVLGAGLLLAISTFSRNQKEAQTYLGPVFLLVTVAAMLSMFIKAESGWPIALVPILNAALILKQAISNTFDPLFIIIAFAASIAYAAVAVAFATRLFEKESVLLKA
jgi:sodium transport system permease protein